jgi:dihydroneopterin triphosphate diphosphatase
MTSIATDIVDVYVFRRLNARVQFLLLQRRSDVPMGRTWQAFHHEIAEGQTASDAARAALNTLAGLEIDRFYSADFVNQFYDEARDVVVLAPVLAVTLAGRTELTLADDFEDAGWYDRDEATARLPFSGQRWAVRHIDEIMGIGESEAEMYRFEPSHVLDTKRQDRSPSSAPARSDGNDEQVDDIGLEPPPETAVNNDSPGTSRFDEPLNDSTPSSANLTSRQD